MSTPQLFGTLEYLAIFKLTIRQNQVKEIDWETIGIPNHYKKKYYPIPRNQAQVEKGCVISTQIIPIVVTKCQQISVAVRLQLTSVSSVTEFSARANSILKNK